MTDLISRQAAINAILHYTIRIPGYMSEWGRKLTAAIKKDFMDEINAIPHAQRWIPVSERLPEPGQFVIVTVERTYSDGKTALLVDNSIHYSTTGWWSDTSDTRTLAWMPLPEPYKGEKI